jgi:AcrR family transcriptional regulator
MSGVADSRPISRRERLRREREEQILEAAAAVFARKGFHQATIQEIAEQADVAAGTIYNYYADKRDMLVAITRQVIANTASESLAAHQIEDDLGFLTSILSERLEFAWSNLDFTRALLSQVWSDDVFREQYLGEVIGPLLEVMQGYLQARIDSGTMRPVNSGVIVRAMAGSFLIFVLLAEPGQDGLLAGVTHQELARQLADFFLNGLGDRTERPAGDAA